MQRQNRQSAYQHCLDIASRHYENFPTASLLLNKEQRNATAAIYAFARYADDIADEGNIESAVRLHELDNYQQKLDDIYLSKNDTDPVFIALADAVKRYQLPRQTLGDLLTAFRMDVNKKRYNNFDELRNYCRHSANPIGELVLRLHGAYSQENKRLSDCVCTALQLINFVQDIDEDMQQRDRIYIPLDEMQQFAVAEASIKQRRVSAELEKLVAYQLTRAQNLLLEGSELVDHLHGKIKWVIALTVSSGMKICDKLHKRRNCYTRPTLTKLDWIKIGLNTVYFRAIRSRAKLRQSAQ